MLRVRLEAGGATNCAGHGGVNEGEP